VSSRTLSAQLQLEKWGDMLEADYTRSITKALKPDVYSWKINAAYAKGVPDLWLCGDKNDLWVEVKYLKSVPKRGRIVPNLSRLQEKWLQARHKQGRNVVVLVGTPLGGYILTDPQHWVEGFITSEHTALTKHEVAAAFESVLLTGVNSDDKIKQPFGVTAD
jgi:hypothetical protein